jgi:hypothetical protein
MTLLREIQLLLEQTYGKTGVNFEEFLLPPDRATILAEWAGRVAAQISDLGRTFFRMVEGDLRVGIYYDQRVIAALEHTNPQYGLNDENILAFMVFLEELDHAVHAALKFQEGRRDIYSETFVRDLELQAKVDVYLILQMYVAHFNKPQKLTSDDRRWLRTCVFESDHLDYDEPVLRDRYRQTNRLARQYARYLDGLAASRRTVEIRRFRPLPYSQKCARIAAVTK